jgi:leader peptidase (prepilin peptidase) / N-methyltransferase
MPMIPMLLYALVGAAVGSFLNVVIDRVPERQSVLYPGSRCPACNRRLTPRELIPVISYLALRGRCRNCGAAIPIRVVLVEALTALLFAFLWRHYGPGSRLLLATFWSSVLLVLLVIDLEQLIVPDVIILPAIALALVVAVPLQGLFLEPIYGHYGLMQLLIGPAGRLTPRALSMLSQVLGGIVAFGIFWLIWLVAPKGMGAGDVRLAALIGLLTGLPGALVAVFGSFLLGSIVGVALLVSGVAGRKTAIPFAPFLVVTTFWVMLYVDAMVVWYIGRLFGWS